MKFSFLNVVFPFGVCLKFSRQFRVETLTSVNKNKRRDVALTGREVMTCDFCDKRRHDTSQCWKNPDNRGNRLDSSSDAGPSTGYKHKKKAPNVEE
jgi:hypothetical protein